MEPTEDDRKENKPHLHKAYEDPHYHDDDLESAEDSASRSGRGSAPKKPARRIPPPPRHRPADD